MGQFNLSKTHYGIYTNIMGTVYDDTPKRLI